MSVLLFAVCWILGCVGYGWRNKLRIGPVLLCIASGLLGLGLLVVTLELVGV